MEGLSFGILFSSGEGQTEKIAKRIGEIIEERGHKVFVLSIGKQADGEGAGVDLNALDGVIVGASIHVGKYSSRALNSIKERRGALSERPSAFFAVCLTAAKSDQKSRAEVDKYLKQMARETGWHPGNQAAFAGALLYTKYSFLKRQLMKTISKKSGGDIDTSRDYEYTDWEAVRKFAEDFALVVEEKPAAGQAPSE